MKRLIAALLLTLIPAVGWATEGTLNITIPGTGTPLGVWIIGGSNYPENIITNPAVPTQHWLIDSRGYGPMTEPDGANVTLGTVGDAAWTGTGSATGIAALKAIYAAAVSPITNFPSTVDTNSGVVGASTIRVVLANNQPTVAVGVAAGTAIMGKVGIDQTTPGTTNAVVASQATGSNLHMTCDSGCGSAAAQTPVVANAVTSKVLKASAGTLYSTSATNYSSTTGFMIVYNATAAPSPGALTAGSVLACAVLPGSGSQAISYNAPATFSTGIVVLLSSGADCVTYTTGTITGYISGQVS